MLYLHGRNGSMNCVVCANINVCITQVMHMGKETCRYSCIFHKPIPALTSQLFQGRRQIPWRGGIEIFQINKWLDTFALDKLIYIILQQGVET